jgi:hypothetical protein
LTLIQAEDAPWAALSRTLNPKPLTLIQAEDAPWAALSTKAILYMKADFEEVIP